MTLDTTFAALADPTRRGVIDLLRKQPWRAGDLADQLGMSRPAMSRHLKVLRTTGLIEPASDEDDMRARVYRLRPEPFSLLRTWLDDVERFWSGQLASFKAYAEARAGLIDSGPVAARGPLAGRTRGTKP
jgi:DNA-binding transcriptional ArsR family regulator